MATADGAVRSLLPTLKVCVWLTDSAVAFGYFENLFMLRDVTRVQQELARIKSLNSLLDQVGQEEHLYEIFVDATEEVFNAVIQSIQNGAPNESFLVNAFNEEYNSNALITHFRVRFFPNPHGQSS
jgi:ubiquitin thioesterase protein OTUB1